ncbi:hypothetical protein EW145_g5851 [Phellinidium pouzarii]|uniref:Uncharacterized protein n=1 Tax=Phellinidium pouzarii TaxID=167371 RepID=A0A4S4KYS7_9AGAM|nr:hypothetical protein EW145_g5851 [Phellinidium pouzarii]
MASRPAETKPLPLSDTLQDLAVLRASDTDLSVFSSSSADQEMKTVTTANGLDPSPGYLDERSRLVAQSFDYVHEARAAIRILQRGEVDIQGARIDQVRSGLEDVLGGLDAGQGKA